MIIHVGPTICLIIIMTYWLYTKKCQSTTLSYSDIYETTGHFSLQNELLEVTTWPMKNETANIWCSSVNILSSNHNLTIFWPFCDLKKADLRHGLFLVLMHLLCSCITELKLWLIHAVRRSAAVILWLKIRTSEMNKDRARLTGKHIIRLKSEISIHYCN